MKLLIGYDGSQSSDAAIEDLRRAGLPDDVEALLLTAAWLDVDATTTPIDSPIAGLGIEMQTETFAKRAVEDANTTAQRGLDKLRSDFPGWKTSAAISTDSPGSALVLRADAWRPDLIVVGSHGHSAAGRFFLGSTSQGVLHHAKCSVRVARGSPKSSTANTSDARGSVRLVLGVDGSPDSLAASRAVGQRNWSPGAEVWVVGATDLTAIARAVGADTSLSTAAVKALHAARLQLRRDVQHEAESLRASGLAATTVLRDGSPKRILVEEAEKLSADCIFIGARGMGRLERLVLGSVSGSVAARAHCSVEVVRR